MNTKIILILCVGSLSIFSCKKFLDGKPSAGLVIPETLEDVDALLNNNIPLNLSFPYMPLCSSDEYYLTGDLYNSLNANYKSAYTWGADLFMGSYPNDWSYLYDMVYIANISLETLEKITPSNKDSTWNRLKGEALFFRSFAFYELVSSWASCYDDKTAESMLGIPLRRSSDFNLPSSRQNVKECYSQIIKDLELSTELLPLYAQHPMKPSALAAYGLLSRVYLQMQQYGNAKKYAELFLNSSSSLMDYNEMNAQNVFPFERFNKETVFFCTISAVSPISRTVAKVDSLLVGLYDDSLDLRKKLFFLKNSDSSYGFRGSYSGGSAFFHGIATDEQLIIHAECAIRLGNTQDGIADLNRLLEKRYKVGAHMSINSTDADYLLKRVLLERRKELCFRSLRWADLKRLNMEETTSQSINRLLDGQITTLPPNDNRFNLPIPQEVINITGMEQNPR